MREKKWRFERCDGCKLYNRECRMGVCGVYPYKKQKKTEVKKVEVHDTG